MDSKVKFGKYYWKLNVGLLEDEEVCENFKIHWADMKQNIDDFDNINCWWELYAKKKIKTFFIAEGKIICCE